MIFQLFVPVLLLLLFTLAGLSCIKPKMFPPGPAWFPFVGCFLQFQQLYRKIGYCHLIWAKWAEKYGPIIGLKLGKDKIVVVSGYKAIKHAYSKEDFDGRPDGFFFRMRTFHQRLGVVFVDGELWSEQRKFTTRHLRTLGMGTNSMENIINEEVEALIRSLNDKIGQNKESMELELHNLCDISILNTLWAVVAGKRFELEDPRLIKMFKLQHASFRAIDMSGGLLNQMPFLRHVMPERTGYKNLMENTLANYQFLRETLEEHKETHVPGEHNDLIDAFIDEIDGKKDSNFTDEQLLALCQDLFMAGSETTSTTLGFLFEKFLIYQKMQSRVQNDIDAVVGRGRLPNLSDRTQLPYLEAIIMETQRLISIAPITVPHRATKDVEIYGHVVPKDTTVLYSIWSIHMEKEHWKDPENFRPERFLNKSGDAVIKDEWFMPFGLGKRRCLGEAQAKNSLFLFMAGLLQNFSFVPIAGGIKDEKPFDGVTLSPKPFKGLIKRRL
ncbi:methyl farnesoate epoxidase-like [Cloeon dipterum]|uniref:methyl farnesoate epoxidase-like n=1 Tax=Cloeon dipterum TaxID=197152 RepID=UPI003220442D